MTPASGDAALRDGEVWGVILAVRWYLRFGLSYRDVEVLLAEGASTSTWVTIYRWVKRLTPLLTGAARPGRRPIGGRKVCRGRAAGGAVYVAR
jgi:hypothetical protein